MSGCTRHYWMLLAVAAAASTGCGAGPFSPSEARTLAAAEARWAAQGPAHYTIEMRRICFCPPEVTEWATVEVRDGEVVATKLLSGDPVPASLWSLRPPVADVFAQLHAAPADWVRDVTASYDPVAGYPTAVAFDSKEDIADAGWTLEARNLVPLD